MFLRAKLISSDEIQPLLKKVWRDSSFKGAVCLSKTDVLFENQKLTKSLRHEGLRICKEVISTIPNIVYTRKDFYLLNELNKRIAIIKNSGLIDFWYFQEIHRNDQKAEAVETKKLTMDDIMGCFQILIIGLIASFVSFVVEVILNLR